MLIHERKKKVQKFSANLIQYKHTENSKHVPTLFFSFMF